MAIEYTSSNIKQFENTIDAMLCEIGIVVGGTGSDPDKLIKYAEAVSILSEAQINVNRLKRD